MKDSERFQLWKDIEAIKELAFGPSKAPKCRREKYAGFGVGVLCTVAAGAGLIFYLFLYLDYLQRPFDSFESSLFAAAVMLLVALGGLVEVYNLANISDNDIRDDDIKNAVKYNKLIGMLQSKYEIDLRGYCIREMRGWAIPLPEAYLNPPPKKPNGEDSVRLETAPYFYSYSPTLVLHLPIAVPKNREERSTPNKPVVVSEQKNPHITSLAEVGLSDNRSKEHETRHYGSSHICGRFNPANLG